MTGWVFAAGSLVLGGGLVTLAIRLATQRTEPVARRLFLATLAYLPLLLGLMVMDRAPAAIRFTVATLAVR
jgi:heme O synthase-like polyprenyltransferase